ncbi:MAG TPA: hypothetical protein VN087_16800 [Verrucomicrobiae bacterium]|nr:hypothetical protein [Verrucomicrobiae bacterium]
MKQRLIGILVSATALLMSATGIRAQDQLVPAGTLLQCTLDEPNFSSATAAVGDPVLCHLRTTQEFGRPLFPRGSMLGGHLEAEKDPGHFVGKGYIKITFDRVILPNGDLPVPAKVIQARGYKVDKQGAIDGNGHATRDVVEWMLPPLWPWKIITLPLRGPRPTLKGEEPLELRLMDDIVLPQSLLHPDRPPYASSRQSSHNVMPQENTMQVAAETSTITRSETPANQTKAATGNAGIIQIVAPQPGEARAMERVTILALKSDVTYEVTKYQRDGDLLMFVDAQGRKGGVDVNDVDWRKTSEMTAAARSADMPLLSRQTN